jgi:hypothetical protein
MSTDKRIHKLKVNDKNELNILNIGLEIFYNDLRKQGVNAIHVAWKPPVKLEKDIEDILSKVM